MTVNDFGNGLSEQAGKRLLYGLRIDPLRMDDVVARCRTAIDTHTPLLLGVLNAAKVVNLKKDPLLRDALLQCDLLLADGQSIVWASRLLRRPLPERVAGIDIFEQLLAVAEKDGRSIYLLGAKPEVLETLVVRLGMRFPRLKIAGRHHGYFGEDEGAAIAADIRASGADMLFLGMVSPKKEIFLGSFAAQLNVPVLHGVGGSFDIVAGITKRAPLSWQRMGIEWLYRVLQEPRRMWRRYLTTNFWFLLLTARELVAPSPAFEGHAQDSVLSPEDQPVTGEA
jgi:N-acetylglucosaminyldiphosphoundecaprenol N-acetyl-beta-D-mannosaminyltransferase